MIERSGNSGFSIYCAVVKLRNPIDQPLLLSSLQRSYRSIQTRDIKGDLPAAAKNSWRSGPRCYGEDTRIWRGGGQVALASHNWHILICNMRENPNPHLLFFRKVVTKISSFALFKAHLKIYWGTILIGPLNMVDWVHQKLGSLSAKIIMGWISLIPLLLTSPSFVEGGSLVGQILGNGADSWNLESVIWKLGWGERANDCTKWGPVLSSLVAGCDL